MQSVPACKWTAETSNAARNWGRQWTTTDLVWCHPPWSGSCQSWYVFITDFTPQHQRNRGWSRTRLLKAFNWNTFCHTSGLFVYGKCVRRVYFANFLFNFIFKHVFFCVFATPVSVNHFSGYSKCTIKSYSHSFRIMCDECNECSRVENSAVLKYQQQQHKTGCAKTLMQREKILQH